MPTYAEINSLYATYNNTPNEMYYELAGFNTPPSLWGDLVGQDPFTSGLLDLQPVFYDALYEPRMIETHSNMAWYDESAIHFYRHAGYGMFYNGSNGTGINGFLYDNYLDNITFGEFTVSFCLQLHSPGISTDLFGSPIPRIVWRAGDAVGNTIAVEIFPIDTANRNEGDPCLLRINLNGTDTGSPSQEIDVQDFEPHHVILTREFGGPDEYIYSLYIDGQPTGQKISNIIDPSNFDWFGGGTKAGEEAYAYVAPYGKRVSMSHLAIYNYAMPLAVIQGLPANMRIPETGGGLHVVEGGYWRRTLL